MRAFIRERSSRGKDRRARRLLLLLPLELTVLERVLVPGADHAGVTARGVVEPLPEVELALLSTRRNERAREGQKEDGRT